MSWRPSAALAILHQRADLISAIRDFFKERKVLEVETPLLSHRTVTDPYVIGIPALFQAIGDTREKKLYLQTSPEYAMKRLLAFGSGPIYQITKAFRQGEVGKLHNPEFTMLEWYRPGFDHHDLMDEMDLLLQKILKIKSTERITYQKCFEKYLNINPHFATMDELKIVAKKNNIHLAAELSNKNAWLEILMTHCIEPQLGKTSPVFLYDFPREQAALAKIRHEENPAVASRFEVYFKGIELANGFHELQNPKEQRERFEKDILYRQQNGMIDVSFDERFLAALAYGLPDCSGVALGIDRLVMLATGCESIAEVISFEFERA